MTATKTDASQLLEAAGELAARVGAAADRIEADRRIPPEIAEELADRGFFRLLLPRSLGGSELEHPYFLKIVSLFARADASAAWCINQNNVFSTNSVRVSRDTRPGDMGRSAERGDERAARSGFAGRRGGWRLPAERPLELQQRDTSRDVGRGADSGLPAGPVGTFGYADPSPTKGAGEHG